MTRYDVFLDRFDEMEPKKFSTIIIVPEFLIIAVFGDANKRFPNKMCVTVVERTFPLLIFGMCERIT